MTTKAISGHEVNVHLTPMGGVILKLGNDNFILTDTAVLILASRLLRCITPNNEDDDD